MAIGGELHADEEVVLSEAAGSKRDSLWGINFYPDRSGDDCIEFNSMINLKPVLDNRSRFIESAEIRSRIRDIVKKLIAQ